MINYELDKKNWVNYISMTSSIAPTKIVKKFHNTSLSAYYNIFSLLNIPESIEWGMVQEIQIPQTKNRSQLVNLVYLKETWMLRAGKVQNDNLESLHNVLEQELRNGKMVILFMLYELLSKVTATIHREGKAWRGMYKYYRDNIYNYEEELEGVFLR